METTFLMLAIRTFRVMLHIAYGLALACVFPIFGATKQLKVMQQWSQSLLKILNVQMRVHTHQDPQRKEGQLILANHISWLDVFVINANTPARFVAKSDVRSWPLIGWMVRRSGTLFIRREYRRDTTRANQVVTNCLLGGECVAIFPQGTTTDGTEPVQFHSAMIQSAIDAKCTVQPLSIRYHDDQGRTLTAVAFTGNTTFAVSLWRILCLSRFNVTVTYLGELNCHDSTRREIARAAQVAVNAALESQGCEPPLVSADGARLCTAN
jgi:1-acyl-sn-glycerol-3-phosphate acyltransferase